MRMWMVDPRIMCRQHLLGEHVEHHMFAGTINKRISVAGYISDHLLEPASLYARHQALVAEMEDRGYRHKSPFPYLREDFLDEPYYGVTIDPDASLKELLRRCPECSKRYRAFYPEQPDEGFPSTSNYSKSVTEERTLPIIETS